MADSVPGVIREMFNAAGLDGPIPGNLWNNEPPESVDIQVGPVCVLEMTQEFEFTFEKAYIERDAIKLTVYGITAAVVEAATMALQKAFFWQPLALHSDTPIMIEPLGGEITAEQVRWRTGDIVFHWATRLNVGLTRTLA